MIKDKVAQWTPVLVSSTCKGKQPQIKIFFVVPGSV